MPFHSPAFPPLLPSPTAQVTREHAGSGSASSAVSSGPMNPHGILEAYWLYCEGAKPEGTANSLLGAQPLVVQDLALQASRAGPEPHQTLALSLTRPWP